MELSLTIRQHKTTGWLLATCDQLPELIVQGNSLPQIAERAPNIAERVLERRRLRKMVGHADA